MEEQAAQSTNEEGRGRVLRDMEADSNGSRTMWRVRDDFAERKKMYLSLGNSGQRNLLRKIRSDKEV